jgi:hypothetical protein
MTYTDNQLKSALAKMLPDSLTYTESDGLWHSTAKLECPVLDTELLHLCWVVESQLKSLNECVTLLEIECGELGCVIAQWQQRVVALAKVKGVEIV